MGLKCNAVKGGGHGTAAHTAACYDLAAPHYDSWKWQKIWAVTEWPVLAGLTGKPRTVVELGVGTGMMAERMLEHVPEVEKYAGVDISAGMLEICRSKLDGRVELIEADAVMLELGMRRFELVMVCRMLSHVEAPEKVFARIAALLARGGRVLVTEIDPMHPYTAARLPTPEGKIEVPVYKHSSAELMRAAEACGLRCREMRTVYADEAQVPQGVVMPTTLDGLHRPLLNCYVLEGGQG